MEPKSPSKKQYGAIPTDVCDVCHKTVYPVEKTSVDKYLLHANCLRCAHCNKKLSLGNYAALNDRFYCKPHFKQLFALKGDYSGGFEQSAAAKMAESINESKLVSQPSRDVPTIQHPSKEEVSNYSKPPKSNIESESGVSTSSLHSPYQTAFSSRANSPNRHNEEDGQENRQDLQKLNNLLESAAKNQTSNATNENIRNYINSSDNAYEKIKENDEANMKKGLSAENESMKSQIQLLQNKFVSMESTLNQRDTIIESLKQQLKDHNTRSKKEIDQLQQKIKAQGSESEKVVELEKRLKDLNEKFNNEQSEHKKELAQLKEEAQIKEEKQVKYAKESEIDRKKSGQDMERLQLALTNHLSTIDELTQEIAVLKLQEANYQHDKQELKVNVDKLTQEIKNINMKHATEMSEIEKEAQSNQSLVIENNLLNQKIKDEQAHFDSIIQDLKAQFETSNRQLAEKDIQFKQTLEKEQKFYLDLQILQSKFELQEISAAEQENRIKDLEKNSDTFNLKCEQLESAKAQLDNNLIIKNQEVDILREQAAQSQTIVQALQGTIGQLEDSLQQIREQQMAVENAVDAAIRKSYSQEHFLLQPSTEQSIDADTPRSIPDDRTSKEPNELSTLSFAERKAARAARRAALQNQISVQ